MNDFQIINPKWPSKAKTGQRRDEEKTPTEQEEAITFVKHAGFKWWGQYLSHAQNEQRSGKPSHGAFGKAEGVRKGYPDYILDLPAGAWHGLRIELKRQAGSVLSADQKEWQFRLLSQGYLSVIAPGERVASAWCLWYTGLHSFGGARQNRFCLPSVLRECNHALKDYVLVDMAADNVTLNLAPELEWVR